MASDEKNCYLTESALLKEIEISVVKYERRFSDFLKDPYVVYLVQSNTTGSAKGASKEYSLWRRYSDFEFLHKHLITIYPYIVMPTPPEKRLNISKLQIATDKFDPEFLERRRLGLECFLLRLASHPVISEDTVFQAFLKEGDGWKEERNYENQFIGTVENRYETDMKPGSQDTTGERPCEKRFEKMYTQVECLESNIASVLKIHEKIFGRTFSILQQYTEYAKCFETWASFESESGDFLRSVASKINALSGQTMSQLKQEETAYQDQLKEYMSMSGSLRSIAEKHKSLQNEFAKADAKQSAKARQKEQLIKEVHELNKKDVNARSPTSSKSMHQLVSQVMGTWHESSEEKQRQLSAVDDQVSEAEHVVWKKEQELNEFVDKFLGDVQRFNIKKELDVTEIIERYLLTQLKVNKLGLKQWKSIKALFMEL